jgi:hypothetical protein
MYFVSLSQGERLSRKANDKRKYTQYSVFFQQQLSFVCIPIRTDVDDVTDEREKNSGPKDVVVTLRSSLWWVLYDVIQMSHCIAHHSFTPCHSPIMFHSINDDDCIPIDDWKRKDKNHSILNRNLYYFFHRHLQRKRHTRVGYYTHGGKIFYSVRHLLFL